MTMRKHVGARIHLYRKKQNLTLEQLALLIHKSPSTVSKYELGKISVDIDTLYDIAEVLNVSIEQLVDYKLKTVRDKADATGFFTLRSIYYMYQYFTPIKQPIVSALEIIPDPTQDDDRIMFYYDIHNTRDYTNANFIYQGRISYYDAFVTMKVINMFGGSIDEMFIYVKNPLWIRNTTTGLLMCQSMTLGNPVVTKVIFSTDVISDNEMLREFLSMYNKDLLNNLKKTNYVTLIDNWENKL